MASNHQRTAGHGLAVGDSKLFSYDVHAGDELRHGVFYLDASVHLEEEELTGWCQEEFNRPGADVVHRFSRCHGGLAHGFAQRLGHRRSGGFFEHLLMAALDAAFSLTEVNGAAVLVGEHLDFNVL